jgi:hypothetical protein
MIKRGYQVKIVSYGGDADWYNTYLEDGLSAEDAKWLHHFFDAYYAKCNHENDNTSEGILEAIRYTVRKLGYIWSAYQESWNSIVQPEEVMDIANDMAYELLGAPCEHSGYWNTVTKMEVHHIPVDIQECSDSLWE